MAVTYSPPQKKAAPDEAAFYLSFKLTVRKKRVFPASSAGNYPKLFRARLRY
ncbi:hypothetical protein AGMMS50268_41360 [Spirochaetia bacterium]|nr:hypothetical protein AGMMS50268_41360 [Spirochaetia bacterium]